MAPEDEVLCNQQTEWKGLLAIDSGDMLVNLRHSEERTLRADHVSKGVILLEDFDCGSIWDLRIFYDFYAVHNRLTSVIIIIVQ